MEQQVNVTNLNKNTYTVSSVVAVETADAKLAELETDDKKKVVDILAEKGVAFKNGVPFLKQECAKSSECSSTAYCQKKDYNPSGDTCTGMAQASLWCELPDNVKTALNDYPAVAKALMKLQGYTTKCVAIVPADANDVQTRVQGMFSTQVEFKCAKPASGKDDQTFTAAANTKLSDLPTKATLKDAETATTLDAECKTVCTTDGKLDETCAKNCISGDGELGHIKGCTKAFEDARKVSFGSWLLNGAQSEANKLTIDTDVEGKVISSGCIAAGLDNLLLNDWNNWRPQGYVQQDVDASKLAGAKPGVCAAHGQWVTDSAVKSDSECEAANLKAMSAPDASYGKDGKNYVGVMAFNRTVQTIVAKYEDGKVVGYDTLKDKDAKEVAAVVVSACAAPLGDKKGQFTVHKHDAKDHDQVKEMPYTGQAMLDGKVDTAKCPGKTDKSPAWNKECDTVKFCSSTVNSSCQRANFKI